jgi:hypothetical protein
MLQNHKFRAVQSSQRCVRSYVALKKMVRMCDKTDGVIPCVISVCSPSLNYPKVKNPSIVIDLSNKNIVIKCNKGPKRCLIDGQGMSRLFYGTNTTVTFRNIIFANGNAASRSGGALSIEGNSVVNIVNCALINNSAISAGAVSFNRSIVTISGQHASFIKNSGSRPPFEAFESRLILRDILFLDNAMTLYVSSVILLVSKDAVLHYVLQKYTNSSLM